MTNVQIARQLTALADNIAREAEARESGTRRALHDLVADVYAARRRFEAAVSLVTVGPQIERDGYLFVRAASPDSARRFFGLPPDWPCERDRGVRCPLRAV